jgi:hypothetical protein
MEDVYLKFAELSPMMKKKIERRASVILAKKITILEQAKSKAIKGKGQKPLFGARPKKKSVFVYGASQNPANVPFLFSSLPTAGRVPCTPHPVQIEPGVWRYVKTNSDTRANLGAGVVDYYTQEAPQNAYFYFGHKRKLIFAKERDGEKSSLYVEAPWSIPENINEAEQRILVEQAFDEAMSEF